MPSLFSISNLFSPRFEMAHKVEPSPENSSSQAPGQDGRSGRVVDSRQNFIHSSNGAAPEENGMAVARGQWTEAEEEKRDSPVEQVSLNVTPAIVQEFLESPVSADMISDAPVPHRRSTGSAESVAGSEWMNTSRDSHEFAELSSQVSPKEPAESNRKTYAEGDSPGSMAIGSSDSKMQDFEDHTIDRTWKDSESPASDNAMDAVRKREMDKGKNIKIEEDIPESSGNNTSSAGAIFARNSTSGSLLSQFLEKSPQPELRTADAPLAHSTDNQEKPFTSPGSIPPADVCFQSFEDMYPKYAETTDIDKLRKEHYAHLQDTGHVCLDYCGYGLFSHYQQVEDKRFSSFGLAYISANLATHALYGAADDQSAEGCIRKRVMQYLNIPDTEYSMVFTASRGSAFKLLAESYPFHISGRLLTVYDHDSESVKWMVESARQRGAKVMSGLFKWPSLRICTTTLKKQIKGRWRNIPNKRKSTETWNSLFLSIFRKLTGIRKSRDAQERRRKKDAAKGLFVFPLQSRITGSKLAHQWMSYAQQNKWHVLLDASALGPKDMSSLGLSLFRPDFIVASFFKVFGADPTGFGCLFIKNSVMSYLQSSYRARGVGMVKIVPYGSSMSPVGSSKSTEPGNSDGLQDPRAVRDRQRSGEEDVQKVMRGSLSTGVSSFSGPVQSSHQQGAFKGQSDRLSGNVYVGYNKDAYVDEKVGASGTTFDSGSLYGSGSVPPSSTLYPSGSFYSSSGIFPSGSLYPSGALLTPNPSGSVQSAPWHVGDSERGRRNSPLESIYPLDVGFSGPMSPNLKVDRLRGSYLRETSLARTSRDNNSLGKGNQAFQNSKLVSNYRDEHLITGGEPMDQRNLKRKIFVYAARETSGSSGGENVDGSVVSENFLGGIVPGSSSERQSSDGVRRENSLASSGHEIDGSSAGDSFATPQAELVDMRKELDKAGVAEHPEGDLEEGDSSTQIQPLPKRNLQDLEDVRHASDSDIHNLASEVSASLSRQIIRDRSLVRRSEWGGEDGSGSGLSEDIGGRLIYSTDGFVGKSQRTSSGLAKPYDHLASLHGTGTQHESGDAPEQVESSHLQGKQQLGSNLKESAVSRESEKAYELLGCRDQRRLLVINREIAEMDAASGDAYTLTRGTSSSTNRSLYHIQEISSGATQSEDSQGESDYTEVLDEDMDDTAGFPLPVVFCQSLDHADFMGLNRTNMRQRFLVDWLVQWLEKLEHPGGRRLVHVYGPKGRVDRGQSVAFNVFDWNGNLLQPGLVQRLADRSNIALGMGSLCNIEFPEDLSLVPGLIIKKNSSKEGENSRPRIRVVTASLGFVTNFEDVYRLWHFLAKFLDVDFLFREVWRYHTLHQEAVVLDQSAHEQGDHPSSKRE